MSITTAKSAGFCFGVSRAVETVEKAAGDGKHVVTLGPIIHNRHVVQRFESMGVQVIASAQEAQSGTTVIIRSHGVSRAVIAQLQQQGVEILDATCPFVKRIHDIVSRAEAEGALPIIIGTRDHAEVQGIAGWCNHCRIFETPEELETWTKNTDISLDVPICMVCQTTSTESLWKKCCEIAKKQFTNLKIYDTICRATEFRQGEAAELSTICDAMVVVGDVKSSNTGRLAMICREHCEKVVLVDNATELDPDFFRGATHVGITAGASTPAWIIKEVNKTMSEITNVEAVQEESFAELLEQSIKTLNTGDKVLGIVTGIGNTEVQVDLGTKHAGYIPYDEVSADPTVKPEDVLKVGDEIEVFVISFDAEKKKISLGYKTAEMNPWNQFMTKYQIGDVVDAKIVKLMTFGAFAEILPGVDGLIHISQIADKRIGKPEDVLAEGQEVQVKITDVDAENKRISLSIRALLAPAAEEVVEETEEAAE